MAQVQGEEIYLAHSGQEVDDNIDEVVAARGTEASLSARLADIVSDFDADQQRQEAEIGVVAALGAKNNADFNFGGIVPNANVKPGTIVCAESNGTFSFSGTSADKNYAAYVLKQFLLKAGTYKITGVIGGSNTKYWMRVGTGTTDTGLFIFYDGEREFNLSDDTLITVQIVICANQTVSNLVFKPMIRPSEITDDTFVPYAPTNRELYEMIIALQSGVSAQSAASLMQAGRIDAELTDAQEVTENDT